MHWGRVAELRGRHEPVLGTTLDLRIRGPKRRLDAAEADLLAALARYEHVFSVYRPDSELVRWRSGPQHATVSSELASLLRAALEWQERSGGIFNPAAGLLTQRWQRAAAEQRLPSDDELATLAADLAAPRYSVSGRRVEMLGDCSSLNFNAIAKGKVVDLAAAAVIAEHSPRLLLVNVGGDLVHRGEGSVAVGIEDPRRPYDNEAPLTSVTLSNAGLATSGLARRGVTIGDRWYSHVLDPRTGWPVEHVASATVIAPDAVTADVVATVASVAAPAEGVAFVDAFGPAVSCLVIDRAGTLHRSTHWPDH